MIKIGDIVQSPLYKKNESGRVINIVTIADINYYEIYFPDTKDTLTLEEKDLKRITDPFEKLKLNEFDPIHLFKVRIISEKLDSLLYQDKLVTANNFKIEPLPHQILTVNYVLEQFKPRCLIADEVGLGKTIEAALIFEELKLRNIVKRIIIITPAGLTRQWKDEMKSKFNEEFTIIDRNTFLALRQIHGNVNIWEKYDRVITSIDFLKPKNIKDDLNEWEIRRREAHNKFVFEHCNIAHWDMVIFDEAHKLSKDSEGSETARYKLGKALSETVPIFLLLTATPHQGDSEKFRHLLGLIDEYKFYGSESLTIENVKSVTVKNKKRAATDFKGNLIFKSRIPSLVKIDRDENDIEVQLYNSISQYISEYYNLAVREGNFAFILLLIIYQRMVSSSSRAIYHSLKKRLGYLNELKDSIIGSQEKESLDELENLDGQEIYEEITEIMDKNKSADDTKSRKVNKVVAIPSMVEKEIVIVKNCIDLAQKASFGRQDFKVRKIIEIINEVIRRENKPKTKFLVFTEFIYTQYYIGEILEELGYKVAYLNGKMSLEEKIDAKIKFKDTHQILVSTDAGGEGINLQFCHVIINYDLPWNPMKIEQRIGRLDRIGQKKDVLVFNFIIKNTVEERVRDILDDKLNKIAEQFGDDKRADVLNLLQEEFNFDRIFIDAFKLKQAERPELEKIGENIFIRAKEILDKQDMLLPFSEKMDKKNVHKLFVQNEENVIKELVQSYSSYVKVELKEYSRRKKVYYTDDFICNTKLKNCVFEKKIALDNEHYEYINIAHPVVKKILEESLSKEALTFNVEIENSKYSTSGYLFYYKITFTNNDKFIKRLLIPIFINSDLKYDKNISKYFMNNFNLKLKSGISSTSNNIDNCISVAKKELDLILEKSFSEAKLELINTIGKEQEMFMRYFNDKENAIKKISIENIREGKLKELSQQKIKEKMNLEKKKSLVPIIKLFITAQVTFK